VFKEKKANILVVTCTKNPDVSVLKKVVYSIQSAINNSNFYKIEHVIVDNNSSKNWWELDSDLINFFSEGKVSLIFQKKQGKKFAIEAAADFYKHDYYAIIDDDNIINTNAFFDIGIGIMESTKVDVLGCCAFFDPDVNLDIKSLAIGCQGELNNDVKEFKYVNDAPWGAGTMYSRRVFQYYSYKSNSWDFIFVGRNGNNLISGEDCEIGIICNLLGYKMGVTNLIFIYHNIKLNRMSSGYLEKIEESQEITKIIISNYLKFNSLELFSKITQYALRDIKFFVIYKKLRNINFLNRIHKKCCHIYFKALIILLKTRKQRQRNLNHIKKQFQCIQ
jgi:hypothetical protein